MSFIAPFPGGGKVTRSFLSAANTSGTATASSYTFSGLNLGTAFPGRYIVAALSWAAASATLTSLTIGGVTAAILVQTIAPSGGATALCIAAVPAGTSGNVAITLTGNANGATVALYALKGINAAAASAIASSTMAAPAATLNVRGGGVVIGVATGASNSGPPSTSWSALTEDAYVNYVANAIRSAASAEFGNGANVTATCSMSAPLTNSESGCFAAFNPP